MVPPGAGGHFFVPAGGVNFCVASVDRSTRRVYVDLGNALPTAVPGGPPASLGDLVLQAPGVTSLGVLSAGAYARAEWYPSTAGIAVFPADRPLSDAELAAVAAGPLTLAAVPPPGGQPSAVISEQELFVRADRFVFRLDPGSSAAVTLFATRFGQPYAGAGVLTVPVPGQLQPDSPLAPGQAPPVAVPAGALDYPVRVVTDALGRAELTLRAEDPGRPRDYIDGQVYALCPVLEPTIVSPGSPYPFNQWNFISALVWSGFEPDEPPTWHGAIEPVLRQYANLYPVMRDFLDLGDYKQVCAQARWLAIAFGRGIDDPASMPVSRDLSAAKRKALLRWLTEPGPDGMPLLGEPPAATGAFSPAALSAADPAAGAVPAGAAPAGAAPPDGQVPPHAGGKAAAASRRPATKRGFWPTGMPR
jgi:hypothetical protein